MSLVVLVCKSLPVRTVCRLKEQEQSKHVLLQAVFLSGLAHLTTMYTCILVFLQDSSGICNAKERASARDSVCVCVCER